MCYGFGSTTFFTGKSFRIRRPRIVPPGDNRLICRRDRAGTIQKRTLKKQTAPSFRSPAAVYPEIRKIIKEERKKVFSDALVNGE